LVVIPTGNSHPWDPATARWPISAIQSVEEVSSASAANSTIEIRFANGDALSVAPVSDFTSALLSRLRGDDEPPAHPTAATAPIEADPMRPPPYVGNPPLSSNHPPNRPAPQVVSAISPSMTDSDPNGTTTIDPAAEGDPTNRRRRRRRTAVAVLVGVLLIALASTAVLATQLRTRAIDAEALAAERATELRTTRAELEQTREDLETTTAELAAAELRVSELANEKAAVQDERNAAQEISRLGANAAAMMADCRDRLLDAMGYLVDQYYIVASAALEVASPICQAANSAVAEFSDALG
jgi:hypothetical protein